jgi:hypothetical protein
MFENMVICVEILLSLDISVKYAQCVKIWMFLKYVSFLKSCVQFLVKCVLSREAKGGRAYRTHVSLLLNMHTKKKPQQIILHGDAPYASTWGAHWYEYIKRICANGHPAARRKKHRVEHELPEIFEANGLPWV